MKKVWKKGAALALAAVMCAGALSGCGKKSEGISAFTYNGKKVDADFANFALRYEQSKVHDLYAYYGFDANGIIDKVREMMGLEYEADESWEDE